MFEHKKTVVLATVPALPVLLLTQLARRGLHQERKLHIGAFPGRHRLSRR